MEDIKDLLTNAGFSKSDDENDYYNDYICVCLRYDGKHATRIVNNNGAILIDLPTNYYAILGWLLLKRFVSFGFIDSLNHNPH